jgi:hypothetical protein
MVPVYQGEVTNLASTHRTTQTHQNLLVSNRAHQFTTQQETRSAKMVATINTNKHRKLTDQPTQSNISELTYLPESNSKHKGAAKRIETVSTGPPSYKSFDHHPSLKTESDFLLRFVLINGEISTHVKQLTSGREKGGQKGSYRGEAALAQ